MNSEIENYNAIKIANPYYTTNMGHEGQARWSLFYKSTS